MVDRLTGCSAMIVSRRTTPLALVAPIHWLSRLAPVQDLLLSVKHLFVAATMARVHPGPAAYWQFSRPDARVRPKKPRAPCGKRGAGPLSDRKSQSIVRSSKNQGGSSVLQDTPVVNCVFNRRQYNFVIGPIPVLYAQAGRCEGSQAVRGPQKCL
jgi:hypothetical protein